MNANTNVDQKRRDQIEVNAAWLKRGNVLPNGSRVLMVEGSPADETVLVTFKQGDKVVDQVLDRNEKVWIFD